MIDVSNGGVISPSVMCADPLNLERDICTLKENGVNVLHIDFMDNKFVPNITFGADIVRVLKGVGMIRDIHIMAYEPEQYFERMAIGEGDIVAVHYEECADVRATLCTVRQLGAVPFLALSPDTPLDRAEEFFDVIGGVLIMSVYPGFAGKPMAPNSLERLASMRKMIDQSGRDILLEIDGNVSWQNAPKMRECGADMFVAGSSSIFGKEGTLSQNIARFQALIK